MDLRAINHWPKAIETHSANHPEAQHIIEDVNLVDPEAVVENGYLDILMASPECKYYSRARGGKPVHDQGRMMPWAIMNWLTKLDIKCVIIENVPEFIHWGPLKDGKPIKARRGEQFQAWLQTFWALGYQAEWRMLNAADYGDATTRTRFFLLARKDGCPIRWPEPTHARTDTPMLGGLLPWRGAREIINWDNPGRSLLDDPKYIKKPLSEKTRQRIARGLQRFGGPLAPLYIRLLDLPGTQGEQYQADGARPRQPFHGSDRQNTAPRSMDEPVHTITTLTGGGEYIIQPGANPLMVDRHQDNTPSETGEPTPGISGANPFVMANRQNNAPKGLEEPIPTITTAHGGGSFIIKTGMKSFLLGQQSAAAPRETGDPVPTVAAAGAISLVRPTVIEYYGNSHARDVELPLPAITGCNKHGLAHPTLVQLNHGNGRQGEQGNNRRVQDIQNPLPSITTSPGMAIANPTLIEVNHGPSRGDQDNQDHRTHSTEEPLPSPTTHRSMGLMQTGQTGGNGSYSRPVEEPLPTLTTRNDMNLIVPGVDAFIVPNFGEREGQEPRVHDLNEPTPSVTSRGAGSLVSPHIDGLLQEQFTREKIDPRRIVFIDGQPFLLDIRFRMLQNPELARAMGFSGEETEYEFAGNVTEITKQIGNAVAVNLAAAVISTGQNEETNG